MGWSVTRFSTQQRTGCGSGALRRLRSPGSFWLAALLLSSSQSPAAAEPLDLFNPRPREIVVAFEISPREVPAQMDTTYTPDLRAFVEPGLRDSEMRVVIPSQIVEEFLLGDQKPVPESFSDFVWTFDVATGHVVSARLSGRVRPRLDWGFMTTETQAEIEIEMGTARVGGFKRPQRVLGQLVFRYCTKPEDSGCRVVETTAYDRSTGYVNAVGQVRVHSPILDLRNFSPMGEAIFSERNVVANGESGVEFLPPVSSAKLSQGSSPSQEEPAE